MNTITTRTDLVNYLSDVRADLASLGDRYVQAVCDQIQASDHPAWGEDWTEWLGEWVDSVITETVDGLDAIEPPNGPCRGPGSGCSCGAPGCDEDEESECEDEDLNPDTLISRWNNLFATEIHDVQHEERLYIVTAGTGEGVFAYDAFEFADGLTAAEAAHTEAYAAFCDACTPEVDASLARAVYATTGLQICSGGSCSRVVDFDQTTTPGGETT